MSNNTRENFKKMSYEEQLDAIWRLGEKGSWRIYKPFWLDSPKKVIRYIASEIQNANPFMRAGSKFSTGEFNDSRHAMYAWFCDAHGITQEDFDKVLKNEKGVFEARIVRLQGDPVNGFLTWNSVTF